MAFIKQFKEGVWVKMLNALMVKGYCEDKLSLDKATIDNSTLKAKKMLKK